VSPAVITLIHKGDEFLLARNARFPEGRYSIIAGFVEPGETLEEAVAREIREEVGVEVTDITYQRSQPWPFPHSLMVGFTARWASGEIQIDEDEIVDAGWYSASHLPPSLPDGISISRWLIDAFLSAHPGAAHPGAESQR
jgi:NAD+ diphosphatase